MLKEKAKGKPSEAQSTKAERRDGSIRMSEEGSVMGLEQRDRIIQLNSKSTRNGRSE